VQEIDKGAMGRRIRQIRLRAGLRQWELAKMLGTTQSAVHKYEHGVVPEPRRLVELSRIGGTSIEWVLTGRHWENGSEQQQRILPEVLNTASLLHEISDEDRATLDEALRIVRDAVQGLVQDDRPASPGVAVSSLGLHSAETLAVLEAAWRIQPAVLRRVSQDASSRLDRAAARHDDPARHRVNS
jgi:transcriptional regulator with XRE-family HTH domain